VFPVILNNDGNKQLAQQIKLELLVGQLARLFLLLDSKRALIMKNFLCLQKGKIFL
jgi:hypothetical protein